MSQLVFFLFRVLQNSRCLCLYSCACLKMNIFTILLRLKYGPNLQSIEMHFGFMFSNIASQTNQMHYEPENPFWYCLRFYVCHWTFQQILHESFDSRNEMENWSLRFCPLQEMVDFRVQRTKTMELPWDSPLLFGIGTILVPLWTLTMARGSFWMAPLQVQDTTGVCIRPLDRSLYFAW